MKQIKITSKDGVTLHTANKFVDDDLSITIDESLFEVGGATVTTKEGWQGTAVPNTGYVEKVYFNTNLSVEEVNYILHKHFENKEFAYNFLVNTNASIYINVELISETDFGIVYVNGENVEVIYVGSEVEGIDYIGWNTNITYPLAINSEVISEMEGISIGSQNAQLSSLISVTPLVETSSESISLSGEYDGTPIIIDDLNSKWQGTPVPTSGMVENIYFNTNLSTKEVVGIIESANLNYDEQNIYVLFSNADGSANICVIYVSSDEVYIYNGNTALFGTSKMSGVDWLGWNPNLINNSNCYNLNTENVIGDYGMGTQNAQLSSLISTTPFTQTKANTIDIKALIDKKKIPLEITVNVAGSGGGSGEEYPNEAIKYYKENRNKNYPYFPLPSEMEETQDTIYMLYDANGYMCCPVFNITFTSCVVTIQKYNNNELVSEYTLSDVVSGTTYYMQFSEEDSDYSSYNYIVIKLQGSITKHYLNYSPKFNGVEYNSNSSSELLEVSGKCVSCDIKVVNNNSNKTHQNLEYYSFLGVTTTDMSYMFSYCYSLQTIPQLDTHSVTKMSYMFNNCYSLQTIPLLDTHSVTNMNKMFGYCYSLQTISLLDTHSVTDMSYMFNYCHSLQTIPQLDTHSVTDMNKMFMYCYSLQTIPQLDTHSVTKMSYMFSYCCLLYKLDITNVKNSFSLSDSTMLTQSELVKILNNLATVEKTQTLTLGSTNLAKLTEEEKAIATAKGWTLA